MKIFTNKKVWQKIVLVMLILLLMQFFIGKPAHAIDGDVLLEPITSLFANLGDGINATNHNGNGFIRSLGRKVR